LGSRADGTEVKEAGGKWGIGIERNGRKSEGMARRKIDILAPIFTIDS
jgi:hypothetical protein